VAGLAAVAGRGSGCASTTALVPNPAAPHRAGAASLRAAPPPRPPAARTDDEVEQQHTSIAGFRKGGGKQSDTIFSRLINTNTNE
jgi:hypothetical protein